MVNESYFQPAFLFGLIMATILAETANAAAVMAPGPRGGACSFGFNNSLYVVGGMICKSWMGINREVVWKFH
jgi:hypothetical protein